jgi:hypothetical protein
MTGPEHYAESERLLAVANRHNTDAADKKERTQTLSETAADSPPQRMQVPCRFPRTASHPLPDISRVPLPVRMAEPRGISREPNRACARLDPGPIRPYA